MTDLVSRLLPPLEDKRVVGLYLGAGFIYPGYKDQSILNIPSSICWHLGLPEFGSGPLIEELRVPLGQGYRSVVMILMDALSLRRLQRWMNDGTAPVWQKLVERGIFAPLTSIIPSTTSAALTSLWTGCSAAVHGITGYEMWLKEYGVVANMIMHTPMSFANDLGGLSRAGFRPEKFLNLPTFGSHLLESGVETYAFQHANIINSGLSKMYFNDVKRRAFSAVSDMLVNLRELLQERIQKRTFVYVYWSALDTLSHHYGPDDERTVAEFASFSAALENHFLERLGSAALEDTLLILTADHGQVATRRNPHYDLKNHPDLIRRLHIMPTGENRLVYLHVRAGQMEAVREYIERAWPGQFTVLESVYAVERGLFGPGNLQAGLLDRVGDLILVSNGSAYLWWANKENNMQGRHGGMNPEEMLVPYLVAPLNL